METENQGIRKATATVCLQMEALYHGPDDALGEPDRHVSPHMCQPIVRRSVDLRRRGLDAHEIS